MKIVKELRSKTKLIEESIGFPNIRTSYQHKNVTVYVGAHGLTIARAELKQTIIALTVALENLQNYQCP